jgi:acyl dehydratase
MPIDPAAALAAALPARTTSWDADDVILYHLGVGAGLGRPTDPAELAYTYEPRLVALPTFAVVPPFAALVSAVMGQVPGLDVNPALVLHGEQDLELHRPLPIEGTVENRPRIAALHDKGKAALVVLEVTSGEPGGDPWFTNRFTIFARGEGGFGGPPAPPPGNEPPADAVVESPTMSHQALIYRLSGDKNPLHADPEFARLAGFDRPILHGLCTYGVVCKAVVDTLLGGDVTAVTRYQTRFAGIVFPGETVVTSMWRDGDRIVLSATTKERGQPVLANAAIWTR